MHAPNSMYNSGEMLKRTIQAIFLEVSLAKQTQIAILWSANHTGQTVKRVSRSTLPAWALISPNCRLLAMDPVWFIKLTTPAVKPDASMACRSTRGRSSPARGISLLLGGFKPRERGKRGSGWEVTFITERLHCWSVSGWWYQISGWCGRCQKEHELWHELLMDGALSGVISWNLEGEVSNKIHAALMMWVVQWLFKTWLLLLFAYAITTQTSSLCSWPTSLHIFHWIPFRGKIKE